ncbi:MAG TPA: cysteine desulfurase NifS, partial [Acidimicrobiia bacterium]|nr:cysteine desulfurase NifS [Acidimicrobiia bacterium]
MLDARGVCVSRGSACASGASTPSPILLALGMEESRAASTIRLSFHHGTTLEEINEAVDIIAECVDQLRAQQKVGAS